MSFWVIASIAQCAPQGRISMSDRLFASRLAANTGLYLDVFRPMDQSYGICKGPTATSAEGSGGRVVDIEGHALIENWINNVIVADESRYPNSTACTQ